MIRLPYKRKSDLTLTTNQVRKAAAALEVFGMLALLGWIGIGERIYVAPSLLWPLVTAVQFTRRNRAGVPV